MIAKSTGRVFTLIAIVLIPACARHKEDAVPTPTPSVQSHYKPDGAQLTTTEVIELAKQEAIRQGINLRRFNEPILNYDESRTNWSLLFWGKPQRYPGNHFSVYINDHTRKTSFIGGR